MPRQNKASNATHTRTRLQYWPVVVLLFSALELTAGSKEGVRGIDIIIKKQPTGHAYAVRTDGNGGFTVSLPEAGD